MRIYVPHYYKNFKCIAGDCKHSCCEGWEIDIDSESLKRFENVADIAAKIEYPASENELPHFILKEGDVCPFLRDDKLCQMYMDHGEDFLCQICKDHPRFRNFFTDRIEVGLGLACEVCAKLILEDEADFEFEVLEDGSENLPEDELELLELRAELFEILLNKEKSVDVRVKEMLDFCGIKKEALLGRELENNPESKAFENLAVYCLFRYMADALYDGRLLERIAFAAIMYADFRDVYIKDGLEGVRALSNSTEYNEEKIESMLKSITLALYK